MEVGEAGQTPGADGRYLFLPQRGLVDLDDVGSRAQAILHDQLQNKEHCSQYTVNSKKINNTYILYTCSVLSMSAMTLNKL